MGRLRGSRLRDCRRRLDRHRRRPGRRALASAFAAPLARGVLLEALDVLIGRRDELAGRDAELARVGVAALDDGVEPGLVDPDAGRDVSLLARVEEARLGPPFNQMRAVEAAVGAPLLRASDGRVVPSAAAAVGAVARVAGGVARVVGLDGELHLGDRAQRRKALAGNAREVGRID